MSGGPKKLTVSYGTFSCTLEGFDDAIATMKAVAEFFRDLSAEDRYFGATPPVPDAAMLERLAEGESRRRVEARMSEGGLVLRAGAVAPPPAAAPVNGTRAGVAPAAPGESVAARLARIRAMAARARAAEAPPRSIFAEDEGAETPAESAVDSAAGSAAEAARAAPPAPAAATPPAPAAAPVPEPLPPTPAAGPELAVEPSPTPAGEARVEAAPMWPEEEYEEDEPAPAFGTALPAVPAPPAETTPAPEATAAAPAEGPAPEAAYQPAPEAPHQPAPEAAPEAAPAPQEQAAAVAGDAGMPPAPRGAPSPAGAAQTLDMGAADAIRRYFGADGVDEGVRAPLMPEVAPEAAKPPPAAEAAPEPAPGPAAAPHEEGPAEAGPMLLTDPVDTERPIGPVENQIRTFLNRLRSASKPVEDAGAQASIRAAGPPAEPEAPAAPARERRPWAERTGDASEGEDLDRLMEAADSQLEVADNKRRIAALSHLKAAVAATEAERLLGGEAAEDTAAAIDRYREDLSRLVQAPIAQPAEPARRREPAPPQAESRTAPLLLAIDQRIDAAGRKAAPAGAPTASATGAYVGGVDTADERVPAEAAGLAFPEFAARLGVREIGDLMEAAAAYLAVQEGREAFSRPQIMRKVAQVADETAFSREDGLRAFGALLRRGRLAKLRRGQFTISQSSPVIEKARGIAR
jgi:hypothetical protein